MIIDKSSPLYPLIRICWIALMAALISLGAMVHILLGPVPLTLQESFVTLSGLILGPVSGAASVFLYILAGIAGFPVFSGGRGGIAYFLGPTGGYLLGFVFLAIFSGLAKLYSQRIKNKILSFIVVFLICFLGLAALYLTATIWLSKSMDISFVEAGSIGVLPFLPFSIIKMPLSIFIWRLWQKNLSSIIN